MRGWDLGLNRRFMAHGFVEWKVNVCFDQLEAKAYSRLIKFKVLRYLEV